MFPGWPCILKLADKQKVNEERDGGLVWRVGWSYWGEEGRFHVCAHTRARTHTHAVSFCISLSHTHLSCQKFKVPLYLPVSIISTSSYTSIHFTLPLSACADWPFFAKINISYDRSWRRIFFRGPVKDNQKRAFSSQRELCLLAKIPKLSLRQYSSRL